MTDGQGDGPVVVHPVPSRFAQSLTVQIEHTASVIDSAEADPPNDDDTDVAWARLCAQNARLFDGPILAATRLALDEGTIWCARDSYRRLALRDELKIDLAILSVTTILEAADGSGRVHVLLGRRGLLTRSYPGMWELGPAGGLDVPPIDQSTLRHADVVAQVNKELREETGIRENVSDGRMVAVVFDPLAGSYDIVVRSRLDRPIEQIAMAQASEPWEYSQTRWLALDDAPAFVAEHHSQIIGPTRALLGWLGAGNGAGNGEGNGEGC